MTSAGAQPRPGGVLANRRVLLLLGGTPAFALVVFIVGMAAGVRGNDIPLFGLALAMLFVGVVPLILDQGRPPVQRHLLLSMFCLVFLVYMLLPAFTRYLPGEGGVRPPGFQWAELFPPDVTQGLAVSLVGLLSLLVAYALPIGASLARILPAPTREWTPNQVVIVAMVMVVLGWIVNLSSIVGIIPKRFGSGVLGVIAAGTLYGIILLALAYFRYRAPLLLISLLMVVPVTSFFNFFTGSKRLFLSPPAMVVLAWILLTGRLRIRWIALAGLALTMLYPAAQFYRDVVLAGNTLTALYAIRHPVEVMNRMSSFFHDRDLGEYFQEGLESTGARTDGLGRASVIIRETPRSVPFQGGWTLGQIFLAYVPRILWPGKPDINIGGWVTQTYGGGATYIQSATGPTWIGEFYLNFGIPGVIGGMAVFGMLLRLAHESFFRRTRTVPALLAGGIILYKLAHTVGGGVVSPVNGVIFALGPIVMASFAVRMLGRRIAPAPSSAFLEPHRGAPPEDVGPLRTRSSI